MLKKLLLIIINPDTGTTTYTVQVLPILLIPTILMTAIFYVAPIVLGFDAYFGMESNLNPRISIIDFIGTVGVSPIIETFILKVVIRAFHVGSISKIKVAVFSALVLSALHSCIELIWGVFVFWQFFIYSLALIYRNECNHHDGTIIAIALHSLNNLFAWGLMLISR